MTSQLPEYLKCPISLEIMSDPVILASGHTFDRESIQRWFDTGNRTCPITKIPLSDHPALIPNHALRSLISSITLSSSDRLQRPQTSESLLNDLTSSDSDRLSALRSLHRLCRKDPVYRRQITESGRNSLILQLASSTDPVLQESALLVLFDLSLDDDNKVGLVAEGALNVIVNTLKEGHQRCKALAATILTSLCMVEVNKGTVGSHPFVIPILVKLLEKGERRSKREAATAIYTLCSFPENQRRVVRCGAIGVLLDMAGSGVERATEVLSLLAKSSEGKEAILEFSGSVQIMVGVLIGGTPRGISNALLTLTSLCAQNVKASAEAAKSGALEVCSSLATIENEKIRRQATSLLRAIRDALGYFPTQGKQ